MTKTNQYKNRASDPNYVWCSETNGYEKKDRVVKFKKGPSRFLHHAMGSYGFTTQDDGGFTVVKIFRMKDKSFCSTHHLSEKLTTSEVRAKLFSNISFHRTLEKKVRQPYKGALRYTLVDEAEWEDGFEPNVLFSKQRTKDRVLTSLSSVLSDSFSTELTSRSPTGIMRNLYRCLANCRREHLKGIKSDDFPLIEVKAIWVNYDPETGYVFGDGYDSLEPLHYSYQKFTSLAQMNKHPV